MLTLPQDQFDNFLLLSVNHASKKKNGPVSKLMFEVISWKLSYENHSFLLLNDR